MDKRFLLADVGGTNTRLGLGGPSGLDPETVATFRNSDHAGFVGVLSTYLDRYPGPLTAICAGVAGPVRDGNAQLTNLDWFIDAGEVQAATGAASVHLINDLQAQGYALDDLPGSSITSLFPGLSAPPPAARLVMGLGTGCNIAVVHRTAQGLFVPASETGHTSLPHFEGDAGKLVTFLSQTHFHKPIEAALSGTGLARIYRYISGQTLPTPDIIRRHVEGDIEATSALALFTEILGTVAGNIALSHLPMGGLFFIGGTARAVAPHLAELRFLDYFTAKGPYTPIVQDIPVFLIDDDTAALHGCARYLRQVLPV